MGQAALWVKSLLRRLPFIIRAGHEEGWGQKKAALSIVVAAMFSEEELGPFRSFLKMQERMSDAFSDNEMDKQVADEVAAALRKAGITPEQAQNMSPEELYDKLCEDEGDPEYAEADQKHEALKNKREGEAPFIARTVPHKMEGWVISFATMPSICEETCTRMWAVNIHSHPGSYMIGSKFTVGRPTAKDCILTLQVAMAFPLVGKPRRPMTLLLAWRMKDMLDELDHFCMEMDIMPRHETLQAAYVACEEHGTDVNGHNHPIDNLTVEKRETSKVEKLKEEGNEFFVCKRYQKALTKYSEAIELDSRNATLYSNRSICYLRLGHAEKALADAEEAIRLKPAWDKPYSRKAEGLRAQGRLDDVKQLYRDCIKRFRKHNMFWKDALQKEFPEASS